MVKNVMISRKPMLFRDSSKVSAAPFDIPCHAISKRILQILLIFESLTEGNSRVEIECDGHGWKLCKMVDASRPYAFFPICQSTKRN